MTFAKTIEMDPTFPIPQPFLIFSARLLMNVATFPGGGPGQSSGAGSPFSDYTAGAVIYVLLAVALVLILLIGAFIVVNLGMMSKRPKDRALPGKREPSDPAFLKFQNWPEVPYEQSTLPADDDSEEEEKPPGEPPHAA